MGDSGLIVGVSGLRGIVGESLTAEVAVRYAAAFGSWLRERSGHSQPQVLVCRDGRAGGGVFLDAVCAGLRAVGCDPWDCGVLMTPTAGVIAVEYDCVAAMIVTASHNPGEWNGLKCLLADGSMLNAPFASEANEIVDWFQQGRIQYVQEDEVGERSQVESGICVIHASAVSEQIEKIGLGMKLRGDAFGDTRVVLDSVNASGSEAAESLMNFLMTDFVQLHGDDSGIFPHAPEPTRENLTGAGGLCDAVPGLKAAIGFAQDPDADRLAVVDELGEYIGEEYTLVLCAMALMEGRMGEEKRRAGSPSHQSSSQQKEGKPMFVVNLSTSRMIDDVANRYGCGVVRTAVGEANVVEAMKALTAAGRDVVLGGEGNGGVIWAEVTYVRDSLSGMALILSLMARTGKTVSELVSMIDGMGPTDEVRENGYTILKAKSALAKKSDAEPVVEHLNGVYSKRDDCRVDLQDGIRIDWDEKGVWAHVRASNTEAIMRVIVEAPSGEEAERVALEIEGEIGRAAER